MRIVLVALGLVLLVDAALRKRPYRIGVYDFDDESDVVLDRRSGSIFEILLALALIVGGLLSHGSH